MSFGTCFLKMESIGADGSRYGVDRITGLTKACKVSQFSIVESIHLNGGNTVRQSYEGVRIN